MAVAGFARAWWGAATEEQRMKAEADELRDQREKPASKPKRAG